MSFVPCYHYCIMKEEEEGKEELLAAERGVYNWCYTQDQTKKSKKQPFSTVYIHRDRTYLLSEKIDG